MTAPTRFYGPKQMVKIAELFDSAAHLITQFDDGGDDNPLYIADMEIVVRHKDGYTVGRITIVDDYPVFELTDETYGGTPT